MKLRTEELQREFRLAATKSHLGLAVSLTEQCNFRCTYCYETFELRAMSEELFEGLRKFVQKRIPELRTFSLSWFGGEPLLERKRMASFTAYCRELCRMHSVRMADASVPTNAWGLTRTVLEELVSAGVRTYMVSLDGEGDIHDQTRQLISGKGTFNRIYENLLSLRESESEFKIILRLHLHKENIQSQFSLADRLHEDFGSDLRFSLHPITIGNFGGESVKTMNLLSSDSHAIESALVRRFRPESNDGTEIRPEINVCYASKPNHLFVRPSGQLAKCTSALDREDNDIGRLRPDGTLQLDERKALEWSFGFRTGDSQDLSCPFFTKPQVQPITIYRPRKRDGEVALN